MVPVQLSGFTGSHFTYSQSGFWQIRPDVTATRTITMATVFITHIISSIFRFRFVLMNWKQNHRVFMYTPQKVRFRIFKSDKKVRCYDIRTKDFKLLSRTSKKSVKGSYINLYCISVIDRCDESRIPITSRICIQLLKSKINYHGPWKRRHIGVSFVGVFVGGVGVPLSLPGALTSNLVCMLHIMTRSAVHKNRYSALLNFWVIALC
jgi:hypothetical protein